MSKKKTTNQAQTSNNQSEKQKTEESRPTINDSDGIAAWQSSESVDEVVQRLRGENGSGPTKDQVQAWAVRMRKYKVRLKSMPRGKNGQAEKRYAPLRELAERLLTSQTATVGERVEV